MLPPGAWADGRSQEALYGDWSGGGGAGLGALHCLEPVHAEPEKVQESGVPAGVQTAVQSGEPLPAHSTLPGGGDRAG